MLDEVHELERQHTDQQDDSAADQSQRVVARWLQKGSHRNPFLSESAELTPISCDGRGHTFPCRISGGSYTRLRGGGSEIPLPIPGRESPVSNPRPQNLTSPKRQRGISGQTDNIRLSTPPDREVLRIKGRPLNRDPSLTRRAGCLSFIVRPRHA